MQSSMCVRSGPGVNRSQIAGVVPQAVQAGLKYWPCNSSRSRVVLLVPGTVSFVLERLLENASKLHTSQRLKPIEQNSYISNSYVPNYKTVPLFFSLCTPCSLHTGRVSTAWCSLCPWTLLSHPGHALPP